MKFVRLGLLLAIVAVLLPFFVSRVLAPSRRVVIHADSAAAEPVAVETLRVVAWNIAHGRGLAESNWDGGDRETRLAEIARQLREFDADVVVLNEVDFDCSWSGGVNQAEFLAEEAGYPHRVEARNLDFRVLGWRWKFGNAVLSRFPIESARVLDFPGYSTWETMFAGEKRGVVCEIRVGDRLVRIVGAHLCHRSESVRVESASILAETAPAIIAGDLNSAPSDLPHSVTAEDGRNAIDVLDQSAKFRRESAGKTFPAEVPIKTIDWILIPRAWSFENYQVAPTDLSDHCPVIAEIRLPQG